MICRVCTQGSPLQFQEVALGSLPNWRPCLLGIPGSGHQPLGFLPLKLTCSTRQLWPLGDLDTQLLCRGFDVQPLGLSDAIRGTLLDFSIDKSDMLSFAAAPCPM